MKNYLLFAAVISLGLASCTNSETNVETVENPDGTITTTTIEKKRSTSLDTTNINTTVDQAKERLDQAETTIDAVAKGASKTFEKAGEDVKDAATKGAEKVEKGAEKIKEDLKKK